MAAAVSNHIRTRTEDIHEGLEGGFGSRNGFFRNDSNNSQISDTHIEERRREKKIITPHQHIHHDRPPSYPSFSSPLD